MSPCRRPYSRRRVVRLLMLLAVAATACGTDGERGSATSAPAAERSTTAPESTVNDSTTPRPTSAPTTEPTTETPSTAPPPPAKVLVVGDSVGFTLAEYAPASIPGVTGVISRALAGCGLIPSGPRPAAAVAAGAPPTYDDCAQAVVDADQAGLAEDPDVVLLVTGAWERSAHERDGEVIGPGDDAWRDEIAALMTARVESLLAAGPAVVLWVDPCAPEPDKRRSQMWYRDEVVRPVAVASGAVVLDPTEVVCTGDGDAPREDVDGVGNPRPDDGQHWSEAGAAWLWTTWLGPRLALAAQR